MSTADEALARAKIAETIAKYGYHYDGGDLDAFVALFTDDAVVDITPDPGFFPLPLRGSEAIRQAYEGRLAEVSKVAQRRHVQSNTVIHELNMKEARCSTFLTVISVPHGGTPELRGTGVYRDRLERVGSEWLFVERDLLLDGLKTDD